jgi:plastocyanin
MKAKIFAVATTVALLIAFGSAVPAHSVAILSIPGSAVVGFATPIAATSAGTAVTYVNLDQDTHNVESVATGPDTKPWCLKYHYTKGHCPLFRSDDLSASSTGEVFGTSALKTGSSYDFICSYHRNAMKGTLKVQ